MHAPRFGRARDADVIQVRTAGGDLRPYWSPRAQWTIEVGGRLMSHRHRTVIVSAGRAIRSNSRSKRSCSVVCSVPLLRPQARAATITMTADKTSTARLLALGGSLNPCLFTPS
jgi:hypothetical protein